MAPPGRLNTQQRAALFFLFSVVFLIGFITAIALAHADWRLAAGAAAGTCITSLVSLVVHEVAARRAARAARVQALYHPDVDSGGGENLQ